MSDGSVPVRVGETVPDFSLTTFEASTGKFGKFEFAAQKAAKRWTVLFFYPADFTFV
jgi:NADH-dependent peroxiredoxin subunit C